MKEISKVEMVKYQKVFLLKTTQKAEPRKALEGKNINAPCNSFLVWPQTGLHQSVLRVIFPTSDTHTPSLVMFFSTLSL